MVNVYSYFTNKQTGIHKNKKKKRVYSYKIKKIHKPVLYVEFGILGFTILPSHCKTLNKFNKWTLYCAVTEQVQGLCICPWAGLCNKEHF